MRANTAGALVVALIVVVGLFVLFGGGAMTGGRMGGGMMGNAWMGGLGWMWIPVLLTIGLVALLVREMSGRKP